MQDQSLFGISDELDEVIFELAYLARRYQDSHYANAGDASQVLSVSLGVKLLDRFASTASAWYPIAQLERLAEIRGDGRSGYRSEGITDRRFYELLRPLAGRVLLITRTGADLCYLKDAIARDLSGKLLTVIELDSKASSIRILYGNAQYGSIPSIETHVHLLGNAIEFAAGSETAAVLHSHPYHLVALGRHPLIAGDSGRFNAVLNAGSEGFNRNYAGLVEVVPYYQSGTQHLVQESLDPLARASFLLWMNHGVLIRGENLRRTYTLLGYGESGARSALDSLHHGALDLPRHAIDNFLTQHGLVESYESIRVHIDGQSSPKMERSK